MEEAINRTVIQDSFEFGKASSRMNLKFMDNEELDRKIKGLRELGYIDSEGNPTIPSK